MGKKITLLVLSIVLVLSILIGSTYSALFKVDEGVEQSYATGILEITSNATNNSVTLTNALPMEDSAGATSTPYTFKITNTGNLNYKFNVKFLSTITDTENMINVENIKIKVNDHDPVTLNSLTNGIILENIELAPRNSVEITLRVWLDINTQNTEMGKVFNAKIVTEGQAVHSDEPYEPVNPLDVLASLNLTDSIQTNTPDFSKTSCSSGCDEATVGIYSMEDDLGTSYYFRGDVENNYVKFANLYWRIIRINGDGTVRMIYDGTTAHANGESSEDRSVGQSAFNSSDNDNTYVGYMYGTAGATTYAETHSNKYDSDIKTYLEDEWYPTLSATDKGKIADAIYCNDRSLDTSDASYTGIGTAETYYAPYQRLIRLAIPEPTLKCENQNDRFTYNASVGVVLGNDKLEAPVGLITADESILAGSSTENANENYYLYSGDRYWTMSPTGYYTDEYTLGDYFAYEIFIESQLSGAGFVNYDLMKVRPVISLKAGVLKYDASTSNGSKDYPFVVG